jgi:hypothetical protein
MTHEIMPARLAVLAERANVEHHAFETTQSAALAHAIAAGTALIEAKSLVRHGEWLDWVAEHCDFTDRTAQRYMQLARNPSRVSDLSSVREALAALTRNPLPPPPTRRGPSPAQLEVDRQTSRSGGTRTLAPARSPSWGAWANYLDCWVRVPWVTDCPRCGTDLYTAHD